MGKFVIRQVNTGIKFDLKATNGQVIASSEIYDSKDACLNGVESVRKNAATENIEDQTVGAEALSHPKFEVFEDKGGQFRFRLKARNGQIVAVSEGYTTHKACLDGVESVRKNAPEAAVEEG